MLVNLLRLSKEIKFATIAIDETVNYLRDESDDHIVIAINLDNASCTMKTKKSAKSVLHVQSFRFRYKSSCFYIIIFLFPSIINVMAAQAHL